ncbi:MAG: hypothetical protein ISS92_02900 [Candidatus Omnitrophica bacterium]|nr:hypothetical protein [Candidatus Omnitrophota bacterium]
MNKYSGHFLIPAAADFPSVKYKVISAVTEFESGCSSIVVESLNPDYYLLFGQIELIVAERGGALAHLAILAGEYNIPIFMCDGLCSRIPPKGVLSISGNTLEIKGA